MRKLAVLLAFSGLCAWSQSLDLSSLDKLASKAKEVNKVSLDHDDLQMALKFASGKTDKMDDDKKRMLSSIDSVQVRNYEFEKEDMYSDADVDAVRKQVEKMHGCKAIVDSKEEHEHSQVFMCSEGGKPTGLAVISAEPTEISVVFVKGAIGMNDMGKLNGVMGMPRMELHPSAKDDK